MNIKFKKLHEDAIIPTRGTADSAGLDIYALEDCEVLGTYGYLHSPETAFTPVTVGQASIKTGIMCEIPDGYYGKVEARSGLSFGHGIETGAGVVDSGFRGEIGVKVYNFTDKPYKVTKGQRIAQMVIQPYLVCEPIEAEIDTDTERGTNGFGSTGK